MLKKLQAYIKDKSLLQASDRLLLAVSGGGDSMVMLHLFRQLGYPFVVAHCNFNLRGAESDAEEQFLRNYCQEHQLELHVNSFNTQALAQEETISIEMAARKLRYDWFEELCREHQLDYTLTAHHQDDLVETMLINLSRGTGIAGLKGIPAKRSKLVRPMLFASRAEIEHYAKQENIAYKTDSSNADLVYQRNMLRHQIIPLFQQLNPAFKANMLRTAANLAAVDSIYQADIEQQKKELLQDGNIRINQLLALPNAQTYLYELIKPYGFNAQAARNVHKALSAQAGLQFYSKTHRVLKDRDLLIIEALVPKPNEPQSYALSPSQTVHLPEYSLEISCFDADASFKYSTQKNIVELDADLLSFPLQVKQWEQGEYFIPLGMKGKKKLSDFFTDQKLSIIDKEKQWIVYNNKDVLWIVGRRIDDRYKISQHTKRICRITQKAKPTA